LATSHRSTYNRHHDSSKCRSEFPNFGYWPFSRVAILSVTSERRLTRTKEIRALAILISRANGPTASDSNSATKMFCFQNQLLVKPAFSQFKKFISVVNASR